MAADMTKAVAAIRMTTPPDPHSTLVRVVVFHREGKPAIAVHCG
jgi:hypothetical protein